MALTATPSRAQTRRAERQEVAPLSLRGGVRAAVPGAVAVGLLTQDVLATAIGLAVAGLWWVVVSFAEQTIGRGCGWLLGLPQPRRHGPPTAPPAALQPPVRRIEIPADSPAQGIPVRPTIAGRMPRQRLRG